jgi:hypothetical protein
MLKLKIFVLPLIIISIFLFGCNYSSKKENTLQFKAQGKKFNETFEIVDSIKININVTDDREIVSITKLVKKKDGSFIILDAYNHSLYLVNEKGEVLKTIARKGRGPGEFNILADFTVDEEGNIYALGMAERKVGKFNSSGDFIKSYEFSFSHRGPQSIEILPNGHFLIGAMKNLTTNSTKKNYEFVDYEEFTFLHVYSPEFKILRSFLSPTPKLKKTRGKFARMFYSPFVQYAVKDGKLFVLTQEGFYTIQTFDANDYSKINSYKIESEKFTEFDLRAISDLKFVNKQWNYSRERLGEINASYSRPHEFYNLGKTFIIEIHDPFDNYYPQYRDTTTNNEFHYDIFEYEEDELIPQITNVSGEYKIIGKNDDESKPCLYFVKPEFDLSDNTISVYKATFR